MLVKTVLQQRHRVVSAIRSFQVVAGPGSLVDIGSNVTNRGNVVVGGVVGGNNTAVMMGTTHQQRAGRRNMSTNSEVAQGLDPNKLHIAAYKATQPAMLTPLVSTLLLDLSYVKDDPKKLAKELKLFATDNRNLNLASFLLPLMLEVEHNLTWKVLPELIWSMGVLGFHAQDHEHRPLILRLSLHLLQGDNLNSRQFNTALGGMVKLQLKWYHLDSTTKQVLMQQLQQVAPLFCTRGLSAALHSLSKLGIKWSDLDPSVQTALLESLVSHTESFIPMQRSMLLYSLGIMGFDVNKQSPFVADHIQQMASSVLQEHSSLDAGNAQMVAQQCSNAIYGLAKMHSRFDSFAPELQQLVETSVQTVAQYCIAQELAMTVYSLGVLGAKWSALQPRTKTVLQQALQPMMTQFAPRGVASVLYGLHLMHVRVEDMVVIPVFWAAVDAGIVGCFGKKVAQQPLQVSQAIANTVYSLGKMNVAWEQLSSAAQQAIYDTVCVTYPHLTTHEISAIIYGLGLLKAPFAELSAPMLTLLERGIQRVSSGNHEQELGSILPGLVKMGATWTHMSASLQQAVLQLITDVHSMQSLCLATTMYSLGKLKCKWTDLPAAVVDKLSCEVQRNTVPDQNLANVVHGLNLMGATWDSIPVEFRESLSTMMTDLHALDAQHVSNVILSLGKLKCPWSALPAGSVEQAVVRCVATCNNQELSNFFLGLTLLETTWTKLSLETIKALEGHLLQHSHSLNAKEIAHLMYAMPVLTFDFPQATTALNPEEVLIRRAKWNSMFRIHDALKQSYVPNTKPFYTRRYNQFVAYFELMRIRDDSDNGLLRE